MLTEVVKQPVDVVSRLQQQTAAAPTRLHLSLAVNAIGSLAAAAAPSPSSSPCCCRLWYSSPLQSIR